MREFLLHVRGELAAGRSEELLAELGKEIAAAQALDQAKISDQQTRDLSLRWPSIAWGELAMVAGMICLFANRPAWESELVAIIGQELDRGRVCP